MSIPRPKLDPPPFAAVAEVMRAYGLPAPISVDPLAPAWVHQNYVVRFAPGSGIAPLMLRRLVTHPGYDTFQRERAALAIARTATDLPVAARFSLVPTGILPWPAALSDLLPGVHGGRLVRRDEAGGAHVAREVGRVMAILADRPRPTWGTRADDGQFVPRRSTWREEWAAIAWGYLASARAAGATQGPLTDRLVGRLADDLPALDGASTWCLVHDDLHPSNLLFDEADPPRLTGLVDWEGAFVGDPLAEWAQLLERPPELVGRILQGYGPDRARAVLDDPDVVARIEVYVRTRSLKRLAFCGTTLLRNEWGSRRAYALEYARMLSATWDAPDAVRSRILAALDGTVERPVPVGVPADGSHRLLWQALESTRFHPMPGWAHAGSFAGALASARIAAETVDEPAREAWCQVAGQAIRRLGRQVEPVRGEPIADRADWSARLTERIGLLPTERTTALACWWLAVEGLEALGAGGPTAWPVSDDLLRGLETFTHALVAGSAQEVPLEPAARLIHGLLGLAAAERLPIVGVPVPDGLVARVAEQVQHSWEDLTIFRDVAEPAELEVPSFRDRWPVGRAEVPSGLFVVPALLQALRALGDRLPAAPGRVLAALGPWP